MPGKEMGVQMNKKLDHIDINGQFHSLAEASGAFLLRLHGWSLPKLSLFREARNHIILCKKSISITH